jgi:hypothetical protein
MPQLLKWMEHMIKPLGRSNIGWKHNKIYKEKQIVEEERDKDGREREREKR